MMRAASPPALRKGLAFPCAAHWKNSAAVTESRPAFRHGGKALMLAVIGAGKAEPFRKAGGRAAGGALPFMGAEPP